VTRRAAGSDVRIKRAYERPTRTDGYRILVDRLWPRGVSREQLALAAWHRELAPSDELRRWFAHDPERWEEFAARYRAELAAAEASALLDELVRRTGAGPITLVYGARDREHNNAVVLRDEILKRLRKGARRPPPRAAGKGPGAARS
jgi:uncharacterized protein YeaO (DUF488 family)